MQCTFVNVKLRAAVKMVVENRAIAHLLATLTLAASVFGAGPAFAGEETVQ
jgi:hypothetical protein